MLKNLSRKKSSDVQSFFPDSHFFNAAKSFQVNLERRIKKETLKGLEFGRWRNSDTLEISWKTEHRGRGATPLILGSNLSSARKCRDQKTYQEQGHNVVSGSVKGLTYQQQKNLEGIFKMSHRNCSDLKITKVRIFYWPSRGTSRRRGWRCFRLFRVDSISKGWCASPS